MNRRAFLIALPLLPSVVKAGLEATFHTPDAVATSTCAAEFDTALEELWAQATTLPRYVWLFHEGRWCGMPLDAYVEEFIS